MDRLTPREQRIVARARWRAPVGAVLGLVLFAVGGAYCLWAVQRLQETPIEQETRAFDRPVARLAELATPRLEQIDRLQTTTSLERTLAGQLREVTDMAARALLMTLRLIVGSMLVTVGIALIASFAAQRRLLAMLTRPA
ncbi:MAG TPA: hypothetical protein VNN07_03050, partial [Candidatus Tectomicrobia bacterium]|nr:hypothetical protein [Candidatus Tectomicrobia bacterium]